MKNCIPLLILLCQATCIYAQQIITTHASQHSFSLPEVICIDQQDDWLVNKAAELLRADMLAVTGREPEIVHQPDGRPYILIGTILDTAGLSGKWEAFRIAVSPGKVVISGSDKRGAAYGVLELSRQLGVSPWYWWADVPVRKKDKVFVQEGIYEFGPPSVQYRGIFINDEAPAFSRWTHEKFGGFNHLVYEKVFELLLRLRGNYLWPAMWGNAFNDDDTLNPVLADKWGIVMGTSHHEPMLRAQAEWKRYGYGAWDYVTNDSVLRAFWRKGIVAMGKHESIVTIGMRGDGDMPMSNETATGLLERIVGDQRTIISEVTGKPATETPQLWALYKEVQDYYDKGMRVPDDVTLLLCDDNWGNIRRLPDPAAAKRKGGYGIYYHFDYVGDPRNYKWVNTNNLARVWEQLHLAKMYGADKIWIVNVGDLKPMELPISFFMDYAWRAGSGDTMRDCYGEFAEENFGEGLRWVAEEDAGGGRNKRESMKVGVAGENSGGGRNERDSMKVGVAGRFAGDYSSHDIGDYLRQYSEMAARRKPELLDESSYTLKQYKEIVGKWEELVKKVRLQPYSAAYFELVQYPVEAIYNLHRLYYAVALYKSNRVQNSAWADSARVYYMRDSLLTIAYHRVANGKWNHMMDQTHIGYTGWQEPPVNKMPDLAGPYKEPVVPKIYKRIAATDYVSKSGDWVHIRGIGKFGDGITSFAKKQSFGDSIIYPGAGASVRNVSLGDSITHYSAGASARYVSSGDSITHYSAGASVKNVSLGDSITHYSAGASVKNVSLGDSIAHYSAGASARYVSLDDSITHYNAGASARYVFEASGNTNIYLNFSPTLNFTHGKGLWFAYSIDGAKETGTTINAHDDNKDLWSKWVADNIIQVKLSRTFTPGKHEIVYYQYSPGIVLQSIEFEKY